MLGDTTSQCDTALILCHHPHNWVYRKNTEKNTNKQIYVSPINIRAETKQLSRCRWRLPMPTNKTKANAALVTSDEQHRWSWTYFPMATLTSILFSILATYWPIAMKYKTTRMLIGWLELGNWGANIYSFLTDNKRIRMRTHATHFQNNRHFLFVFFLFSTFKISVYLQMIYHANKWDRFLTSSLMIIVCGPKLYIHWLDLLKSWEYWLFLQPFLCLLS